MPHPDRLVFDMNYRAKYNDGFYYNNSTLKTYLFIL